MASKNESLNKWFGFVPRSGKALATFIGIIILAFLIGFFLRGGGKTPSGQVASLEQSAPGERKAEPTIWTCSMHPQIQLPKPGKCPICFMDLIPVDTGSDDDELGERQLKMTETAVKLARIETTPVVRKFVEAEIRMAGNITYDETRVANITAWVPGRLDRLHVNYTGMSVNKGEKLVYMYSPTLLSAQEELIQAGHALDALEKSKNSILRSTAGATLEAAREKLHLFGLTDRQIQEIESSGKATDHLTIYAPIGGTVVHKNALEGMYVKTGSHIYTIADLTKVWVLFDAYQSDLPWLRLGQEVEFTSLSFPGEKFVGTITFIDPILDAKTRTAKVRVEVDNKNGRLKPDMFVSGVARSRLDSEGRPIEDRDVAHATAPLVIPSSAPLLTGTRAVVYVQVPEREEPTFEGREIALGPRAGNYYIVKSGVHEGEYVVTNGAFKIDSELQIRAKPSMMSPEGGVSGAVHQHDHGTRQQPAEQNEPSGHEDHERADKLETEVSAKATKALTPLYDAYFSLQMALAGDDLPGAAKSYKGIMQAAKAVDMSLFAGDAHMKWMELSKSITGFAEKGASAEDIEAARDSFLHISRTFIDMHDLFGHAGGENFYLTFCPMTNNNKGAYWLQQVDTVYNPFYGASMLRCGASKKELPPQ